MSIFEQDTYVVEMTGNTRDELKKKALELAAVYFEVEEDELRVLPFRADPSVQIQHGDGTVRYLSTAVGTLTVVRKDEGFDILMPSVETAKASTGGDPR